MKKIFLFLVLFISTVMFSPILMGVEISKDKRLEAMCFEKARYESTYTKEDFSFQYHFDPIFFDLFAVDSSTLKITFVNDFHLIKKSDLRALSHALVILNDWLQLKCFANDDKATTLLNGLREEVLKRLDQIYPKLSSADKISLLHLAPWYEQDAWPYKKSSSKNRLEVLKESYTDDQALRIDRIYTFAKVGIYIRLEDRIDNSWTINILDTIEKEFSRFNKGDEYRLNRILPNLEIVSISQTDDESNGHPNYQGLKVGISKKFNSSAFTWLLWHESGHLFDSSSPYNSDYIASNFCSSLGESAQTSSVLSSNDYERKGFLKSFGSYSDFFTSQYSPDDYRKTKNFELVSYQCNGEWSESLRQSHYNRSASEQVADDFAHFVMYPGRYFFENEMVAPLTFKFFEEKLQANYLDSYVEVFQNNSLYKIELEKAEKLKATWIKNSVFSDRELREKTSLYFKLHADLAVDPIE